jgi:hypothetical protein
MQAPPPQVAQAHDPTFGGRIQDPVNQPTRVTVFPVIASYPHVFSPKKAMNAGEEDTYQTEVWIPQAEQSFQLNMMALQFAANAAAVAKWQAKIPTFSHQPFRDLEVKNEPPDMKGYFLNAKSKSPPGVAFNSAPPGATPVLSPVTDKDMMYAGVICAIALNAYAYDKNGSKGVAWALNNIVILKDGVRMGGGPRPVNDEFGHMLQALPFGVVGSHAAAGAAAAALPPQPGMQQPQWGAPPQQPGQWQQPAPQQPQWGQAPPQQQQWGAPGMQ